MKLVKSIIVLLFLSVRPVAATDFLYNPGTSNNGLIVSAIPLFAAADLQALAGAAIKLSTLGGITNATTGQGMLGTAQFRSGTTTPPTCTAGGNIAGWFLTTIDGTNYEPTTFAPARPPDFIIQFPTAALGAVTYYNSQLIRVPALKFQTLVQNNCAPAAGGNLANDTTNQITLGVMAVKY